MILLYLRFYPGANESGNLDKRYYRAELKHLPLVQQRARHQNVDRICKMGNELFKTMFWNLESAKLNHLVECVKERTRNDSDEEFGWVWVKKSILNRNTRAVWIPWKSFRFTTIESTSWVEHHLQSTKFEYLIRFSTHIQTPKPFKIGAFFFFFMQSFN